MSVTHTPLRSRRRLTEHLIREGASRRGHIIKLALTRPRGLRYAFYTVTTSRGKRCTRYTPYADRANGLFESYLRDITSPRATADFLALRYLTQENFRECQHAMEAATVQFEALSAEVELQGRAGAIPAAPDRANKHPSTSRQREP